MKKQFFILFIMFAVLQWTCSDSPFGLGSDDSRDWVAMTAVIEGYQQIVLVDFNDPSKYRLLTDNKHRNFMPTFSPDHKLLIYQSRFNGTSHDNGLFLVDPLFGISQPFGDHFFGQNVVWHPSGQSFYFTISSGSPGFTLNLLRYDFTTKTSTRITRSVENSEWPVGFKGPDTLIAFSNDTRAAKNSAGFYFMDLNGDYLSRIDNPHLETVNRNGVDLKAAFNPEWNDELQLFAYADVDSAYLGFRIAVTNLDGSYYQIYTDGDYFDDYPSWGPGGETILFDRHKLSSYGTVFKVMIVDLETGSIIEFVKPKNIRGATSLRFPDY